MDYTDRIICGDALTVLQQMLDNSVDAVVTDPPAGIGFMNVGWDSFAGSQQDKTRTSRVDGKKFRAVMTRNFGEVLRVLKPGGHALVWALPRTSHWTGTALEDAGFEIRDRLSNIFGQGFPKSKQSLKPAVEDWWLCRKALSEKNIAANIQRWGVGGLNIESSRAAPTGERKYRSGEEPQDRRYTHIGDTNLSALPGVCGGHPDGRWPANVVFSHEASCVPGLCAPDCPVFELDQQSGIRTSGKMGAHTQRSNRSGYTGLMPTETGASTYGDSGSASRYFVQFHYSPKASRADRTSNGTVKNTHPTVKSTALMAWLVGLITPPGGLVLDPFAGSGSTLVAAKQGGWHYLGIEKESEYVTIAQERLQVTEAA